MPKIIQLVMAELGHTFKVVAPKPVFITSVLSDFLVFPGPFSSKSCSVDS